MKILEKDVKRRTVVEAYARYDCLKKAKQVPDFAVWDWSLPEAIDAELNRAGLKSGILAGYLLWDAVEVTISDLRSCAIVESVFPGKTQNLGRLERMGELVGWKPNRETSWYERILRGRPCGKNAPLVLRPAVVRESPAHWYIEDGSGGAAALIANEARFRDCEIVAMGFLGTAPDPSSRFMQKHFPELTRRSET
jgi:hypothetical protein